MTGLLSPPQELLKLIITYAVADHEPINVNLCTRSQIELPALALTSSKLYHDTLPICYAVNTFRFTVSGSHDTYIKRWILVGKSSADRRKIQDIILAFKVGFDPNFRFGGEKFDDRRYCEIGIKVTGDDEAAFEFLVGLEYECACTLRENVSRRLSRPDASPQETFNPALTMCFAIDPEMIPGDELDFAMLQSTPLDALCARRELFSDLLLAAVLGTT